MKNNAKKVWSGFAPLENLTGTAAPRLIKFANINKNQKILDVACGTGVVALTAARTGANVFGSDLTPELLEKIIEKIGNKIFKNKVSHFCIQVSSCIPTEYSMIFIWINHPLKLLIFLY